MIDRIMMHSVRDTPTDRE